MVSSRFSGGSSSKTGTINSCASALRPVLNPMRPTPHERRIRQRVFIPSFLLKTNSTSRSSTSLPDNASRHKIIYVVNARVAASPGKKRSKWHNHVSSHAPRTGLLFTPPSRVTLWAQHLQSLHRALRSRAIIAQSLRHAQLATPSTHDVVTVLVFARSAGRLACCQFQQRRHAASACVEIWFLNRRAIQRPLEAISDKRSRQHRRVLAYAVHCTAAAGNPRFRTTANRSAHAVPTVPTAARCVNAEWAAVIWPSRFLINHRHVRLAAAAYRWPAAAFCKTIWSLHIRFRSRLVFCRWSTTTACSCTVKRRAY